MKSDSALKLWSSTRRITVGLLALWLAINLLGPWFARDFDHVMGREFPFGFWVAAEGALFVYLGIIVWYSLAMDRIEQRYLESEQPVAPVSDPVTK